MLTLKIIVLMVSHAFSQGTGSPPANQDLQALQARYNQAYEQMLTDKTLWPQQLQKQTEGLRQAQMLLDASTSELGQMEMQLDGFRQDLENQRQHLEFLKKVEPRAEAERVKIRQGVVASGEFNSTSAVTQASLQQKAETLNAEANVKQTEMGQNQQQINNLINAPEYQGYIRRRSQLNQQKSSAESERSQKKSSLQVLEWRRVNLQNDLRRSERNEENARIRMVNIDNIEIPNLRRENRNITQRIQNLRQENQQKRGTLQQVEANKATIEARLAAKKQELNAEGADTAAIQAEISQLEQRMQQQNQRIRRLTAEIRDNRQSMDQLDRRRTRNQNEISRLQNERDRQQRVVADEEIRQIRLEGDIRDADREIADLEFEISNLNGQIASLDNQIRSVQGQINQYYSSNIRPIELVIARLNDERLELLGRRENLLQARQNLVNQDLNVAEAQRRIPGQERKVQQTEQILAQQSQGIELKKNEVTQLQVSVDEEVKDFNTLIAAIETKRQNLTDLQDELIEMIESLKQ